MAALTLSSIRLCSLALGVALALSPPALAADVSVQLDAGSGFSVKNSTGATERLRVDEATGNLSRNGALFVHTTGTNNTFVGESAGNTATTGAGRNAAIGYGALQANTTGHQNTALGDRALLSNTTGHRNAAAGSSALRSNTTGVYNSALGANALLSNTTGSMNSAVGYTALRYNTSGGRNSAVGKDALRSNTTGNLNTAIGYTALRSNTTGNDNSAVGSYALRSNTTGYSNAAVGRHALFSSTSGHNNSAVGTDALRSNTTGSKNSAFGSFALRANSTGSYNSAVGFAALFQNSAGQSNTAVGTEALELTTGDRNIAIGFNAGELQTTGSDNIYLANTGAAGESGQIKIGIVGTHTQATIAGIHGQTSSGGIGVLVNASGSLGTTTSSIRFKTDVRDMQAASDVLMKLRPVVFRYRADAVGAQEAEVPQYGLIAEEVARVAPELVAPDLEGKPYSVRYHVLPSLLLGEAQKQHSALEAQRRINEEQQQVIAELTSRLALLEGKGGAATASKAAAR